MKMDILNIGTDETEARYHCDSAESLLLMMACRALRENRFPGVIETLGRSFDSRAVRDALGNDEAAEQFVSLIQMEQQFHQALHLFPEGHDHGDEH